MPLFSKSKVITCNYCGHVGSDFKKASDNLYSCPCCDALLDFRFSNEEKTLLTVAQSKLRQQEFEEAENAFSDILERFPENHEARWGYVCARYGIKHEEDYNGKIIPTCCLDSITSFKNDKDFLKAVALAPTEIAKWYTDQADYVERISRKWMEEANKEEPYDIFICFKDSDKEKNIDRTADSIDATDLYAELTGKGYRVFFSRISLADKVGEKYEPYIFNALQTAKVLIVFGGKVEYFQSTWMKNEWHRYCKRISLGQKKENSLLVVYKDFNPGDLPSVLSSKQCLDYSSNKFYGKLFEYLDDNIPLNSNGNSALNNESSISQMTEDSADSLPQFTPITEIKQSGKKKFDTLHEHSYVDTIVPGTCITRGYTLHKCKCGAEYKDTYTELGEHKFGFSKEIPASCTDEGKKVYVCSVCGDQRNENIPALGHTYGEWLIQKESECESAGIEARQCSRCGAVITREIPSAGHKWGKWITETKSECEKGGLKKRQCESCGKVETEIIPAESHQFTEWRTTKADSSLEERYCSKCGKTEQRNNESETSHESVQTLILQYNKYKKEISQNRRALIERGLTSLKSKAEIKNKIQDLELKLGELSEALKKTYMNLPLIQQAPYYDIGVFFGNYHGIIEWQVLAKEDDKMLLISKQALDCKKYNNFLLDTTWEKCSLRAWLNGEFLNSSFNETERSMIMTTTVPAAKNLNYGTDPGSTTIDKIFLLSIGEANWYLKSKEERVCSPSPFAIEQGADIGGDNNSVNKATCWWWLRTPGGNQDSAAGVYLDGSIYSYGNLVDDAFVCVRPAMWIKVES